MGTRTLLEFQTNVQDALSRGTIDPAKLTRWVNDALKEVSYAFKFPDLEKTGSFNTAAGQYIYPISTFATDYRMLHEEGLWITSPSDRIGKLKKENHTRWQRNIGDTTDTTVRNKPDYYHRFGRSIYVRPVPDGTVCAVSVHYWKKLVALSAPTDITELQEEWDEIIELGALYRGYRHFREFDRYIDIRNDFLGLVRSRAMEEDVEEIQQGGLNIADSEDDLKDADG